MKTAHSRLLAGVACPLAVLILGMVALIQVESAAHAAEFGGLAVFFVLLLAIPVTLVGNLLILQPSGRPLAHFRRGMILPELFLLWAMLYQSGVWDQLT